MDIDPRSFRKAMKNPIVEYFKCGTGSSSTFKIAGPLSTNRKYFAFGEEVCYGRTTVGSRQKQPNEPLQNLLEDTYIDDNGVFLPFDPSDVVDSLTHERYVKSSSDKDIELRTKVLRHIYYSVRPVLPLSLRSQLQKFYLGSWTKVNFPSWPVDTTVDSLMRKLLLLGLKASGLKCIPFIWFWPYGKSACSIMTHDIEAQRGMDFCVKLMDIDDDFGVPASFQVVPEERYDVTPRFIEQFKTRGFEVNVQDLNHDGRLFWEYNEFKQRAEKINQYGRDFDASGFRSAILYRNQDWFDLLKFDYDMSVPNVAHLDPQRGGCCSVMPYFVGDIVELPVTTTQDHSMFHILNDYSLDLWRRQIEIILQRNGLISFIVHPDYIIERRAQAAYKNLLSELNRIQVENDVWIARPGEVSRWWRNRSKLQLLSKNGEWTIEGPDRERACVAYATIEADEIVYNIPEKVLCSSSV